MKKIIQYLLFGNYFYGLCALALTFEATLQQKLHFLNPLYYVLIFLGSVFYYNKAYIHLNDPLSHNPRTKWYYQNANKLNIIQGILFVVLIALGIIYLMQLLEFNSDTSILISKFSLLLLFPLSGFLYYLNLRSIGWLKPILIGFTWAGLVTFFPLVFDSIENNTTLKINLINVLLFIKNMMFILVLCVLFDIKDYAADYNKSVKTFVVKYGLRNTIFMICLPLSLLGLGTFIAFGLFNDFPAMKIVFNTIPFIFLFIVAYSLKNRRSIFYYLFIIDGLMILKAICGSIAMYFFS